jgi:hypothetical protein
MKTREIIQVNLIVRKGQPLKEHKSLGTKEFVLLLNNRKESMICSYGAQVGIATSWS